MEYRTLSRHFRERTEKKNVVRMPRYYCDYCEVYLAHDSFRSRRQHMYGWKHRANVKMYYQPYVQKAQMMNPPMMMPPRMPPPMFGGMPPRGMMPMIPPRGMPPRGLPPGFQMPPRVPPGCPPVNQTSAAPPSNDLNSSNNTQQKEEAVPPTTNDTKEQ